MGGVRPRSATMTKGTHVQQQSVHVLHEYECSGPKARWAWEYKNFNKQCPKLGIVGRTLRIFKPAHQPRWYFFAHLALPQMWKTPLASSSEGSLWLARVAVELRWS